MKQTLKIIISGHFTGVIKLQKTENDQILLQNFWLTILDSRNVTNTTGGYNFTGHRAGQPKQKKLKHPNFFVAVYVCMNTYPYLREYVKITSQ